MAVEQVADRGDALPDGAFARAPEAEHELRRAGSLPPAKAGRAYVKEGNVICLFQSSQKFKTRYATLGFSDKANLDEGTMWPAYFALNELSSMRLP